MSTESTKQYIYIVQASKESSWCKIGRTKDLKERLKSYNNITRKSQDNIYEYLFTCEVTDMTQLENDIKEEFRIFREVKNKEIYLFNEDVFKFYIEFIKKHPLFVEEISIKKDTDKEVEKIIQYVKKITPTLKERGIMPNEIMNKAQKTKNDEFYTRYEDVEKEIVMYDKEIWKDKVIFCNCDDAVDEDERKTSAFALYFMRNFNELGLKKLICTHYGGGVDIFYQGAKGYIFTYIFTKDGFEGKKDYPKNYDGSFDHPISLKILNEEADIVCTNPPFSRARDYWKIVIESGKKFLIISNFTNIITKSFIPYFIDNKVWAGYNRVDWFENSNRQLVDASGHWYTNFSIINRPKHKNLKIISLKEIPEKYKKYDDSKTLVVDNNYIPNDYDKPFAVSVYPILSGILEKGYKIMQEKRYTPYIDGTEGFARVLVQKMV